jgi:hypothetical protein
MPNSKSRFGPAAPDEPIVFGAAGPGAEPQDWLTFMQAQGMRRVCCLLPQSPDIYASTFGVGRNPYEAVMAAPFLGRTPWAVRAELDALWSALVRKD